MPADVSAARTAEILRDLVRLPSRNPRDGEAAVAAYVAAFLSDLGASVSQTEVLPGRANVVGRLRGGDGPVLAFNTHMDTVPEGSGWTRDPFGGEIADGCLYGRGAVDAKGPLAAFLAAIEAIARSCVRLRGELVMTAVVDEETASSGARRLAPGLDADLVVVGEPTAMQVAIAHRGSLRPAIVVEGRTAHSSRPEQGVNAIYEAVPVIEALRAYADRVGSRSHPLCGPATAAITLASAGIAENVIPGRCELVLDRRLVPGETESDVLAGIEAALECARRRRPTLAVRVDRLIPTTGGASELPADHDLVRLALHASGAATSRPATVVGMSGACDMTHFRAQGTPCVVLGPGDPAQAHQPDEHIRLQDLEAGARAYALLALSVFSGSDIYDIR